MRILFFPLWVFLFLEITSVFAQSDRDEQKRAVVRPRRNSGTRPLNRPRNEGVNKDLHIDPLFLYRPTAMNLRKSEMYVEMHGSYWTTTSNIDYLGNDTALTGDEKFNKTEAQGALRFGFGPRFEVFGGLRWRRNDSVVFNAVTTERYEREKRGLESFFLQGKYGLESFSSWNYAFSIRARKTLYSNPRYDLANPNNSIILGDEGTFMRFGGHLSWKTNQRFTVDGSLYYHVPPSHLAHEAQADIKVILQYNRIAFIAGIDYLQSMKNGDYSDVPENKPNIGTGRTNLFNAHLRQWTAPYGGIIVAFNDQWKIDTRYRTVIDGLDTDKGFEYIVNVVWRRMGEDPKDVKVNNFKDYSLEASVIKVSPRQKFLKLDKGVAHDIEKGMRVDIFKTDYFGGNILVATGIVFEVDSDTSIVKIDQIYRRDVKLAPGLTARSAFSVP